MVITLSILLILSAYLLGSIPTAQLVAHWVKRIDIRQYGSGTVSGSMVWEHVARWAIVPVGLFDIAKGAFPTWLGLQLGLEGGVAVGAGLAAVIGHNWPIYLGFIGGRGLSPFAGTLLVMFPWGVPWVLVPLAVGYLLGDSAPWAFASLVTLPLLVYWLDGQAATYWLTGGMLLLTIVKRLEANRRPLPPSGAERREALLRRLFFDRDIASHPDWINRRPDSS
ncbi:MAG: glycerol-3-phosphate acyltransferase, partial [Anaerolineales bacterium]|jgi:glycerol-3-phosphate acyltransferase PlsY